MKIKVSDIRPPELNPGRAQAAKQDMDFMLANKSRFVNSACPACHTCGRTIFEKDNFIYQACPECRTVFVNPRPPEDLLHEYYAQSKEFEYWNRVIFPASEDARKKALFRPRVNRLLDLCNKYGVPTGSLLEVGAGYGTFCVELLAKAVFRDIIAVELASDLAETCRNRGLRVIESPVETLDIPEQSVDVIASFETIEHLFNPSKFLTDCRRYLKTNGLLVLSCPNYYGFDVLTLGPLSNTVTYVHLNYFNPAALASLMERSGFECLEVLTPGELDTDIVRNKLLQGVIPPHNLPFLRHLLLDRWEDAAPAFQRFLQENKLSSHMWAVGRAK